MKSVFLRIYRKNEREKMMVKGPAKTIQNKTINGLFHAIHVKEQGLFNHVQNNVVLAFYIIFLKHFW
jgi:hypothetical protein